MKNNYFIGLGGSGGKIITALYNRLLAERGKTFDSEVSCIAIDTDQGELGALAELGVQKICISGRGSVGEYYNALGGDAGEWCPNTANESVFFSDSLFNGASQCRMKSRLCFAALLKDPNNEFDRILEETMIVSSTGGDSNQAQDPIVLIASSLAGGTGSGIFIQTALYIKEFFRKRGIQKVNIYGLFACPDIYKSSVHSQQHRNLYSNAYAAIRELNALNLICGPDETTAYGGKLELDIEISTDCEGKLFEKDSRGRYGHKPYDNIYFIDKVNSLSSIRGGLDEYYKAMADIAYTHLYTPIKESIQSTESNTTKAHIVAPTAIYGSAGAATAKYPYEDILQYFAARSVWETVDPQDGDSVWTALDLMWENHCTVKDHSAKQSGLAQYTPAPGDRAAHFIKEFDAAAKSGGITKTMFSFLAPMTERDGIDAVDRYMEQIKSYAKKELSDDERIKKAKTDCLLDDIATLHSDILIEIDEYSSSDGDAASVFDYIQQIDDGLQDYCKKSISYIVDDSIAFSNKIFCDDAGLAHVYDKEEISIINGLLYNARTGEWVHPVAARYLLYSLKQKLDQQIHTLIDGFDTADDDANDFYRYLLAQVVETQKTSLQNTEKDELPNNEALKKVLEKTFGGKKRAKRGVDEYFADLEANLEVANQTFVDALLYFSFITVRRKIDALIEEFETFFDNIDEFIAQAKKKTAVFETMHDNVNGTVYVCASGDVKNKLYEKLGRSINTQTGETASEVSKALFTALRAKAAASLQASSKKKANVKQISKNAEALLARMIEIVKESSEGNAQIQTLDINVFQAMLKEYELLYPEQTDDIGNFSKENDAKERIRSFISAKMGALATMGAPALLYDKTDMYSGLFDKQVAGETLVKNKLSVNYRFISHSDGVAQSISDMLGDPTGSSGKIVEFYKNCSNELPKDSELNTIDIRYVSSDTLDDRTLFFYSAVNCLQPYQINAFDELKGGVYYENYADAISEMERCQKFSMSPHLDKRWHKHGMMPYINVAKELDRRHDLAKAFIFALLYKKIGYELEGVDARYVFSDANLKRGPEIIIHKGRSIPYNRINRVMNWFSNQESLIEYYASKLDTAIELELEELSKYSTAVSTYKTQIAQQSGILGWIKEDIIRPITVIGSRNGKAKTTRRLPAIGILELAYNLHISEENELDKDYGELLIDVLCDIFRRYAKAPYNADHIAQKAQGTESYANYIDIRNHIAKDFLKHLVGGTACETAVSNEAVEISAESDERATVGNGIFGRGIEEPTDIPVSAVAGEVSIDLSDIASSEKHVVWAKNELTRYIDQ